MEESNWLADDEELVKRVTCIDCGCSDIVNRSGDYSGWMFVGYDDDTELHRCPQCVFLNVDWP